MASKKSDGPVAPLPLLLIAFMARKVTSRGLILAALSPATLEDKKRSSQELVTAQVTLLAPLRLNKVKAARHLQNELHRLHQEILATRYRLLSFVARSMHAFVFCRALNVSSRQGRLHVRRQLVRWQWLLPGHGTIV